LCERTWVWIPCMPVVCYLIYYHFVNIIVSGEWYHNYKIIVIGECLGVQGLNWERGLDKSLVNQGTPFSSYFQSSIQVRGADIMCIFIWFGFLRFVLKLDFMWCDFWVLYAFVIEKLGILGAGIKSLIFHMSWMWGLGCCVVLLGK